MSAGDEGQQSKKRQARAAAGRIAPYEMIKQAILTGEIPPGQPLVEAMLAEWCAVSRTPIREALLRLEQDGLTDRTDHGLVESPGIADADAGATEEAHRRRSRRGRTAHHRRTGSDAG